MSKTTRLSSPRSHTALASPTWPESRYLGWNVFKKHIALFIFWNNQRRWFHAWKDVLPFYFQWFGFWYRHICFGFVSSNSSVSNGQSGATRVRKTFLIVAMMPMTKNLDYRFFVLARTRVKSNESIKLRVWSDEFIWPTKIFRRIRLLRSCVEEFTVFNATNLSHALGLLRIRRSNTSQLIRNPGIITNLECCSMFRIWRSCLWWAKRSNSGSFTSTLHDHPDVCVPETNGWNEISAGIEFQRCENKMKPELWYVMFISRTILSQSPWMHFKIWELQMLRKNTPCLTAKIPTHQSPTKRSRHH